MRPSAAASCDNETGGKKSDHQNKSSEAAVLQLPTLIPPKVIPLLRKIALQMMQAGHQNQVFTIYR